MTEEKRIELDALRVAVAKALGWQQIHERDLSIGGIGLFGVAPGDDTTPRPKWTSVPDWPRDQGAAIELCLKLGAAMSPIHAAGVVQLSSENDEFISVDGPFYAAYLLRPCATIEGKNGFDRAMMKTASSAAEALSKLALAALEGKNNHE